MEERPALPPTPQITPPTDELHLPLTQPAPETSGFSEGNAQGACDGKATGNEILGRFLQNLDTAQPPLAGGIAGRKFNSVDNVHDLRYASPKTLFMQIGKSNMPPLLQELYGKLQVARSSHIFPRGSQEQIGSYIHWADKGDSRLFGESQYKGIGIEYPIEKVCQIVDASQDCEVSDKSEAVLKHEVVLRVLSKAIKLSGMRDSVKLESVSSSKISPSSLLQSINTAQIPNKVDYCLYLNPEQGLERRIETFLEASVPFGRSINQTDESRTRHCLPLISIKVTKSLSTEEQLVPLAMWGSAGLERATELFEKRVKVDRMMPQLLISVKGPNWNVFFMHLENPPEGGQPIRKLLGQIPLGSTLDVKDCCAIVSSLVRLIKWVEKKNRQFLEANLPPAS